MRNYVNLIFPILAGVLLVLQIRSCSKGPVEIIRTEIDTLIVFKDSVIFKEKEIPIYYHDTIYQPKIVYQERTKDGETINHYSDTSIIEDDFYIFYNAQVIGVMNQINLSYYDDRPDRIETQTIERTITKNNYISPKGIYWGIQLNSMGSIAPSAMYMWKKNAVNGGYSINKKHLTIGYFRKF